MAELERDDDDDRQVGGDAGYSAPDDSNPSGHDDVPNRDSGLAPIPPKLSTALPARLNADIVRLAADHYAETPLAVLAIAGRATTADDPARYFATSLRGSIQSDELGDRQEQLEHEATDPEAREPRKAITGCRELRGSHSSRCVFDPIGTDPKPHDWSHPPPTPDQILEARNASQPHADPGPRYEPQLLANARAFYTMFRNDYPPDAMREELELRYPSLGHGDLELIVGTPIDTPPPPPERAKEQTTTLIPELRAQLPWKLKVDQPPPETYEELPDHAQLDHERQEATDNDT